MSAASSPTSTARHAAPAQPRPAQAARPGTPALGTFSFAGGGRGDELRLNLTDIPRLQQTLEVEHFKPSLLSRVFDLFGPR